MRPGRIARVVVIVAVAACGSPRGHLDDAAIDPTGDARPDDANADPDDANGGADARTSDAAVTPDAAAAVDAAVMIDAPPAAIDAAPMPDAPVGVISGGPCMSGAAGATAYRIRFANSGGTAYVVYEVNGLPSRTRDKAGVYGYQIGFTPQYVDPFLAQGGVRLDGSDFIDLELTTAGIAQIPNATLAVYGRSFHTTASGSFNWQTFDGTGATPTNFVSNVAPYAWYRADMTTEIEPGDSGVLIRIKAGPNSGVLVVNRIELCMQAS